jgi:hypothetical protein
MQTATRPCHYETTANIYAADARAEGQPAAVLRLLNPAPMEAPFQVVTADSLERLCMAVDLMARRAIVIEEPC